MCQVTYLFDYHAQWMLLSSSKRPLAIHIQHSLHAYISLSLRQHRKRTKQRFDFEISTVWLKRPVHWLTENIFSITGRKKILLLNKIEGYSGIYIQENGYFVHMRKQVYIGGKFIGDIANALRSCLVDSLRKELKIVHPSAWATHWH